MISLEPMSTKLQEIAVSTPRREAMIDITAEVRRAVESSGVKSGLAVIFSSHTTAGITINENADPDVQQDILAHLAKLVPADGRYAHGEGNSDAHIKASMMGSSCTVIVEDGRLALGTWQGIFFCEFDGPRKRRVLVKVL